MEGAEAFRSAILEWFDRHGRDYPWRDPEATMYEVFVAEFFLTQTPADNVADVYPAFVERFPSLEEIDETNPDVVEEAIRPLGFQQMRATALKEIASEYDELPREPAGLQKLPRVGQYVANASVCFALSHTCVVLDRNVRRVYRRVFQHEYPAPESAAEWEFARTLLPDDGETARAYNLALLDLGALRCTKSDPLCLECPAESRCTFAAER